MDRWTLNHFNNWLNHNFREDEASVLGPAMVKAFNDDPEFWANHSYWELYDAVN